MQRMKIPIRMTMWGGVAAAVIVLCTAGAASAAIYTDGFGDGDRNNNGSITPYDTDQNLNGAIDGSEVSTASDPGDTGFVWVATRGFTGSNDGDPKANLKIIDDQGDVDSPTGMASYALSYEAKGNGSSGVGFFGQPISVGPNEGDFVRAQFDFRFWTQANNAAPPPFNGELRWGLFQDTDGQFGQSANVGNSGAPVVWGPDTGENDGLWFDSDPGVVGDKGIYARFPLGLGSSPDDTRHTIETNTARFLEGSSFSNGGDVETVASPPGDGPGGQLMPELVLDGGGNPIGFAIQPHQFRIDIIRTASGDLNVKSYIDGVLMLEDVIDPNDPDVIGLGGPTDTFDYIALRNTNPSGGTGDFDFIIDNVLITDVPEPASLTLLGLGALCLARRRG